VNNQNKLPIATVSELVSQVKSIVNETFDYVAVRGAVTNFSGSAAGHYYFSLSDNDSLINAAMFRNSALRYPLMKQIKDGDQIECVAELTVYEKRGTIQLIVKQIRLAGEAGLKLEFDRIKKKLESLGLFSLERKKRIPSFPKKVAVVSAPNSAAIQDFLNIIKRRGKMMDILVVPAIVQGEKASESVLSALRNILAYNVKYPMKKIEAVVVCRGGGSLEDLWAFNDEKLCLFASDFSIPLISGVGHQTDYSILDYVSDLRAETPSAAAEIITQKSFEVMNLIENLASRLKKSMIYRLQTHVLFLERRTPHHLKKMLFDRVYQYNRRLSRLKVIRSPEKYLKIYDHLLNLDQLKLRLLNWSEQSIEKKNEYLFRLNSLLKALDPSSVLFRGYSIVKNEKNKVISSVAEVSDRRMKIIFKDGDINVEKIN